MSTAGFGRIVWATIPDQRALAEERHPTVILSPDDRIVPGGKVWVVGISTKAHLAPESVRTSMQYDPTGNCRTGLRRECWAVSTWLVEIDIDAIEDYGGTVRG